MKTCITGDWDSGSLAFAISRGLPCAPFLVLGHERRYSWHALVPLTFRIRVSHRVQKLPSEFLLTELGIRQSASRRTSFVFTPTSVWAATTPRLPGHGRQQVNLAAVGTLGSSDGLAVYPDLGQRFRPSGEIAVGLRRRAQPAVGASAVITGSRVGHQPGTDHRICRGRVGAGHHSPDRALRRRPGWYPRRSATLIQLGQHARGNTRSPAGTTATG